MMYYSYVEIEYVATSFSPARTDLALKLLSNLNFELLRSVTYVYLCTLVRAIESLQRLNARDFKILKDFKIYLRIFYC